MKNKIINHVKSNFVEIKEMLIFRWKRKILAIVFFALSYVMVEFELLNYLYGLVGAINIILLFSAFMIVEYIDVGTSLIFTTVKFILFSCIFECYNYDKHSHFYYVFSGCFVFFLVYNIINTSFKLSKFKDADNKQDRFLYSLRFLYPTVTYILLFIITIKGYSNIYKTINNLKNINDKFIYTANTSKEFLDIDYLYFSMTTFFTVGYGDIVAQGNKLKEIVVSEMILGSLLQVIVLPLLITICIAYYSGNSNKEISVSKDIKDPSDSDDIKEDDEDKSLHKIKQQDNKEYSLNDVNGQMDSSNEDTATKQKKRYYLRKRDNYRSRYYRKRNNNINV